MKKNFLLLLLLTLLPLASWAADFDVEISPFNATAKWCGGKPAVTKSWFKANNGNITSDAVKNAIAEKLTILDLDNYNVGDHTYELTFKDPEETVVTVEEKTYAIFITSATAKLTITKYTSAPNISAATVNTDLPYNGEAQALLQTAPTATANNATVPVIYALSNDNPEVTFESYDAVKATNVSTYPVYVKVVETDNYAGTEWECLGDASIIQLNQDFSADAAKPTANALTYTGDAQALVSAPESPVAFGTYEYSTDNTSWGDIPTAKNVNDVATVYWRVKDDVEGNYTGGNGEISVNFTKANAAFTTEPTKNSLTYNRDAQQLLQDAGVTNFEGLEVFFSAPSTTDAVAADGDINISAEHIAELTGTDKGSYYISYKIVGNENVNNFTCTSPIKVVIARKPLSAQDITVKYGANKVDVATATYKGAAVTFGSATTHVYDGEVELSKETEYSRSYEGDRENVTANVEEANKPYIVFTGKANYSGTIKLPIIVEPRDIAGATISNEDGLVTDKVYTGEQITPATGEISFTEPALNLVVDQDYTVTYGENINAGENAGSVTITGTGNYTGQIVKNFNITGASLETATVDGIEDSYTYKAEAWEPEFAVSLSETELVKDVDYTVAYDENINAGTATITITGIGNYEGSEKNVNFNIEQATLTIKVADAQKSFGQLDPTPEVTIEGFLGTDEETTNLTGAYTLSHYPNSEDAGTYDWNVVDAGNLVNYKIKNADPQGQLTINAATVFIRPQDVTKTYSYTLPTLDKDAFDYVAAGLTTGEIESMTFTVTDAEGNAMYAGDMLPVGTYTIKASAATPSTGSYTFDYSTTAILTIQKTQLHLYVHNQEVNYGQSANTEVSDQTVSASGLVDDGVTDLGITIEIAENATSIGTHIGAITLNVDNLNPNYNLIECVAGDLTITGADAITLTGAATDAQTIKDYDCKTVNVTIDFSNRNSRELPVGTARTWEAEKWNTLTLPFDISVKELSKALGYAIVNVIDPEKTVIDGTSSTIYGKLTMTGGNGEAYVLAANKPFMVKTADGIGTTPIDFGERYIKYSDDLAVDAGEGAKFVGSYESILVDRDNHALTYWFLLGNYNTWAYITESSPNSWTILPFEGYIDMTANPQVRRLTFYAEEIDGSVTAINNIDADSLESSKQTAEGWYTLNGVKLNGAPTQKGIYIKDGKKIVIK